MRKINQKSFTAWFIMAALTSWSVSSCLAPHWFQVVLVKLLNWTVSDIHKSMTTMVCTVFIKFLVTAVLFQMNDSQNWVFLITFKQTHPVLLWKCPLHKLKKCIQTRTHTPSSYPTSTYTAIPSQLWEITVSVSLYLLSWLSTGGKFQPCS